MYFDNNYESMILQEAYFGKSKELLKAEGYIAEMINKLKIKNKKKELADRVILAAQLNSSSLNRKIEDCFKKQFGFRRMVLHWDGIDEVNAYSFSRGIIKVCSDGMPGLPIKQSDGGYYDRKHSHLCAVNVYAGLIDQGLTPAEIMAVILHEIGHNFQCTPMTNLSTALDVLWIPVALKEMLKNYTNLDASATSASQISDKGIRAVLDSIATVLKYLYRFLDAKEEFFNRVVLFFLQNDIVKMVVDSWKKIDEWIIENKNKVKKQIGEYIEELEEYEKENEVKKDFIAFDQIISIAYVMFFEFKLPSGVMTGMRIGQNQTEYSGEVFADSFATTYGYGEATVSLQQKFGLLDLDNKAFSKENKYSTTNQVIFLTLRMLATVLDPHPLALTRMQNQINKLKNDLESDDLDPRVKEDLKKQIENMEKLIKEYIDMPEKFRHLSVIMNFNKINKVYFGGNLDYRNFINAIANLGKQFS